MSYSNLCSVVACLVLCSLTAQCFDFPESNEGTFEGDIFYEFQEGGRVKRNAIRFRRNLWPNADVPYVLANSIKSRPNYVKAIKAAMQEWEENTCIRFKERTKERAHAYFFRGIGCYARVGASAYGGQTVVSLGPRCDDFGVAVHEIGHVVGFFHEHTRADRDKYVRILWNNISTKGKRAFMIRTKRRATTLGLPYDYRSAMHYGMYHMTKNRRPTILPRDRSITRLGGRSLSPLDIFKANVLYHCLAYPEFPKDFSWESRVTNGKRCIRVDEPNDRAWRTMYLCYPVTMNDLGLFWSHRGYYWSRECTRVQLRKKRIYTTWRNNYFCYPRDSPYQFYWSVGRPYPGLGCLSVTIDKIPYYLCAKKRPGVKLRVHGRWSEWSPWSPCTLKCGGGVRISYRNCSTPQNGGKTCVGRNIRKIRCNIHACPPWPFWTSEFRLGKYSRVPLGMTCVTIFDEQKFRFCWKTTSRRELNVMVSQNSSVTDMRCTIFPGPRDSKGRWRNKALCLPKNVPYSFQVSTAGPIARKRCLPFGRSLRGRENAYLCASTKFVCPAFWIPFRQGNNLFCYRKINKPMTWLSAQRSCKRLGANLASMTSKKESEFVLKVAKDRHRWIGFNDRRREGRFEWADKSPVTYTAWSRGDPDNGGDRKNEDCVMINRRSGKWNDWPCTTKFDALCKIVAG